jgi:hypothetical protein
VRIGRKPLESLEYPPSRHETPLLWGFDSTLSGCGSLPIFGEFRKELGGPRNANPLGKEVDMNANSHARMAVALLAAAVATSLVVPLAGPAKADHVGTVTVTPPLGVEVVDVCAPFVVTTSGGTSPDDALVDVEVVGSTPVQFCVPEVGLHPKLIDPSTGDLGPGPVEADGTIGGEARTEPGTILGEGEFTFGIRSPSAGAFDITVFVEEPGGPNDNNDPDTGEPTDTASQIVVLGGGNGGGTEVPGATELVTQLDCVPEEARNPSGSTHDFFCRATGSADGPIAGAEVNFGVTNGPNDDEVGASSCGFTDSNGVATCSYDDRKGAKSTPGTDTVEAYTGPDRATSENLDAINSTFAGKKKIKSKVVLKRKLKGKVKSPAKVCKRGRKVLVKKARKGRDRVVAKRRTNKRGKFTVAKRRATREGRFYAVAKLKRKPTLNCRPDRSRKVRRR